jgi:hypothetical protein
MFNRYSKSWGAGQTQLAVKAPCALLVLLLIPSTTSAQEIAKNGQAGGDPRSPRECAR